MKKRPPPRLRDYFIAFELIVMLTAATAFAGSPDYVTVVIENNGTYPVTFQLPTKVDSSDFNPMGGVPVFASNTSPDVRTSVTVDGNQQAVLFMGLEKPFFNVFDILSKDWGFNITSCIQDGPCDDARISGTIKSTSTFNFKQNNIFSTSSVQEMTSSELDDYAKAKSSIAAMLTVVGGIIGFPGSGGMIGGLPDVQAFKVTLTQKAKTRFSFEPQLRSDDAGIMQLSMAVTRTFPASGSVDYDMFAIQNNNIITNGLNVLQNGCSDGKLRKCTIDLSGSMKTMNMYDAVFGATDNAGTKVTVKLAYSRGALVVVNNLPFPARLWMRIGKRVLVNTELMPGGNEDIRRIIPSMNDESCKDVMDPFIPTLIMKSCPVTFTFQSDGGPGINAQLTCVLTARNGTVQAGGSDELNLYNMSRCSPSLPAPLSNAAPNLYKMDIHQVMQMSGMYKMISIDLFKSLQN